VIGRQDGRATAFPSVLAQVRSGAASEHDEGGDHALARGAESSDRRTRLSQAKPDRTLFRGFRVSCAKKLSSKRTAARTRRRMRGSRSVPVLRTPSSALPGMKTRAWARYDRSTRRCLSDRLFGACYVPVMAELSACYRPVRSAPPVFAQLIGIIGLSATNRAEIARIVPVFSLLAGRPDCGRVRLASAGAPR
jgi:hypothetical protein